MDVTNADSRAHRSAASQAACIRLAALRELWIHTGTACNLECPFCLEGSRPGDTRLERVTLAELKPYLDQAAQLGVERFAFTGGEPLIVKDIVKILEYALRLKPCLVLTNGTAPLIKRVHQLQILKQQPHALAFRVSIDHPDEKRHDAQRGWGNFKRAFDGLKLLHEHGFEVSIARHHQPDEDSPQVDAQFRELLRKQRLPETMSIMPLPDFGRPGTGNHDAGVSEAEVAESSRAVDSLADSLMCSYSRMLVKREGQVRAMACALVDDDSRFESANLTESLAQPVALRHHRCRQCVRFGASL